MSDIETRAREIFLNALDQHGDLQAFIDESCHDDDVLRKRVQELLKAHQDAGDFFLTSEIGDGAFPSDLSELQEMTQEDSRSQETIPDRIGPYKLLQEIGEGGMGTVYMAEQEKPIQRRVALKIIKPGMDSKQVVSRFEAERQALSMMDHTNIAHVLDVGTTEQGRPYFVMELIKGLPITRYCDNKKLNISDRLELFKSVCNAVQHAHQKGIIHRDLKPSNILVAEYDGQPIPKIIDFGLAKALHQRLTDKTMFTQLGQIVGTLEYMSPEQSTMNQLEVDTRTDIYSLGVLLYEMLTGTVPFDRKRLRSAALDQVLKIIREEEPPKPSLRLSTVESSAEAASNRGIEPKRLGLLLRGDLDWIVMKAMEKDRDRRYETASGFGMDIERYMDGEPVVAAPPSASYRLKKFIRRNRVSVISATLVAAALVIAIVGTSSGMAWALRERKDADIARIAAQNEKAKTVTSQKNEAVAKQRALSRLDQIEKTNEIIVSIFERFVSMAADTSDPWTRTQLARLRNEVTEQLDDDSIGDRLMVAKTRTALGNALIRFGASDHAVRVLEPACETYRAMLGELDRDTVFSMGSLGIALADAGNLTKAVTTLEYALRLSETILDPDYPDKFILIGKLGYCHLQLGEVSKALPLLESAYRNLSLKKSTQQEQLRPEYKYFCAIQLYRAYEQSAQHEMAAALRKELLASMLQPAKPPPYSRSGNMSLSWEWNGVKWIKTSGPAYPWALPIPMGARLEEYKGRHKGEQRDTPLFEFDEFLPTAAQDFPNSPPKLAEQMAEFARALLEAKKFDDAVLLLRESLAIRQQLVPEHWQTFDTQSMLGAALLEQENYAASEKHLLASYWRLYFSRGAIPRPLGKRLTESLQRMVNLYKEWHQAEPGQGHDVRAAEWKEKLERHLQ